MSKRKARSKAKPEGRDARERLILSAVHEFSLHGYDGASAREIARRAGENQGLVAYYFETKENLWRAAVGHVLSQNLLEFQRWIVESPDGDMRTKARHILMEYVRHIARNPDLMRLMAHEAGHENSRVEWVAENHLKPAYDATRMVIEQMSNAGVVPKAPPHHILYFVIGAVGTIFSAAPGFRQQTGIDPTTDEFIETHARLVADWLLP